MIFMFVTPEDIETLEDIVRCEKNSKPGSEEALKCEVDFHKTLYRISGNQTISNLQKILSSFFSKAQKMREKDSKARKWMVHHEDLLKYIKAGDCEGFIKAMRIHLKPQFELVGKLRNET
jgi:DNA-binding FadR family transcriptional regulator